MGSDQELAAHGLKIRISKDGTYPGNFLLWKSWETIPDTKVLDTHSM